MSEQRWRQAAPAQPLRCAGLYWEALSRLGGRGLGLVTVVFNVLCERLELGFFE
jgi:hypothetical protein